MDYDAALWDLLQSDWLITNCPLAVRHIINQLSMPGQHNNKHHFESLVAKHPVWAGC